MTGTWIYFQTPAKTEFNTACVRTVTLVVTRAWTWRRQKAEYEVRWVSLAVAEKSRNVTPEKKNKNAKFIAVRCKWKRRNIKKEKAKK